jgi:hypothetical protein
MSPIRARAATSSGDPWSPDRASRIPVSPLSSRRRKVGRQKDFVTLAYTLRRGPNCGAPTPMPVPSRSS